MTTKKAATKKVAKKVEEPKSLTATFKNGRNSKVFTSRGPVSFNRTIVLLIEEGEANEFLLKV